jgi:ankyrin repeat protein
MYTNAIAQEIDKKDKYGISKIGYAIIKNDETLALSLLKKGANPSQYTSEEAIRKVVTPNVTTAYIGGIDTDAYPLVILASIAGKTKLIRQMRAKDKQSVYLKDVDGNDALMWASREGHLKTVKLLLSYGLNPLYTTSKYSESAYELALNKHKYKILHLFIDKLIKEDKTDIFPYTIWRLARGDSDIIERLLKLGVKDSYKGIAPRTSLMKAIQVGMLENFKLLLKYGSDPYESNQGSTRYGYDPLTVAVTSGNDKMVKYLLNNFNYDLSKKFEGDNYLHIAAYDGYLSLDKDTFSLLLKKSKLDINSLDVDNQTLLQKAIDRANIKGIKTLLALGMSKKSIKDALTTTQSNIDRYKKQYKKVKNPYNLENLENAKKIEKLLKTKINL